MRETILITGGLGFIGINLTNRILSTTKDNVIIISRKRAAAIPPNYVNSKRVRIIYTDLSNEVRLEEAVQKSTIIIHLASSTTLPISIKDTSSMLKTQIIGTINLLTFAQKHGIKKVLLFSSGGVYGNRIKGKKMDENHPLKPINTYTASKLSSDIIAKAFYLTYKTPIIILRLFNVYGPHQKTNKVIPIFISKLLRNQLILLNHSGKQIRDFIYIDDLTDLVQLILKSPIREMAGETFNICTGNGTSMRKIADIILQKLRKDKSLIKIQKRSEIEVHDSVGSAVKISKKFNWKPKYSLQLGLEKTINWYKSSIKI